MTKLTQIVDDYRSIAVDVEVETLYLTCGDLVVKPQIKSIEYLVKGTPVPLTVFASYTKELEEALADSTEPKEEVGSGLHDYQNSTTTIPFWELLQLLKRDSLSPIKIVRQVDIYSGDSNSYVERRYYIHGVLGNFHDYAHLNKGTYGLFYTKAYGAGGK